MRAANDAEALIVMGDDFADPFARVMAEARDVYGPGRLGQLKWLDARGQMMRPALHPLDPMWLEAFAGYYDSRRLIMLARKGLRAGGSSSACPGLTRCSLFANRKLDAGTIGVIPIMSATRDEADGRFVTIKSYLRAAGLMPPKKKSRGGEEDFPEEDEDGIVYQVPAGGLDGTFRSKRSASGGGIIAIADRHGHRIQFRILPALVKHGVGYTGVAGFLDESDLWPNDPEHHVNPAEMILDRVSERFTTAYDERALTDPSIVDPGAEMLIFSASYNVDSAHKRAVDEALKGGDAAALTYLVRLGKEGARRDEEARRAFAAESGNADPRLWAPGDAMSPDLPAWVYNPAETVRKCYGFSKGDVSRMLAKYGGRAAENAALAAIGPLATLTFVAPSLLAPCLDTVTGIAPDGAAWVTVTVGIDTAGTLHVVADGIGIAALPGSVLTVNAQHEARLRSEIAAFVAGSAVHVPPVEGRPVYDGATLRTGALRTLYERGRIRHAPGFGALEAAIRAYIEGAPAPRVEALVAAVSRLVACYPFLGAQGTGAEPVRGPRAHEGVMTGMDER